jgi:hypothetical protein
MSCVTVLALMSAAAQGADLDLDKVAKAVRTHFRNTVIAGDKFWSNGTLELVQVSPTMAFFRTRLEFCQRHKCELSALPKSAGRRASAAIPLKRNAPCAPGSRGRKTAFHDKVYHWLESTCGAWDGHSGVTFDLKAQSRTRRSSGH